MEKGLPIGNPFCLKSRLAGKFCTSLVSLRLTYAKYASACLTARSPKFSQPYDFWSCGGVGDNTKSRLVGKFCTSLVSLRLSEFKIQNSRFKIGKSWEWYRITLSFFYRADRSNRNYGNYGSLVSVRIVPMFLKFPNLPKFFKLPKFPLFSLFSNFPSLPSK